MKIKNISFLLIAFAITIGILSACGSKPKEDAESVMQKFKAAITEIKSGNMSAAVIMRGADAQDNLDFHGDVNVKFDRNESEMPKTEIKAGLSGTMTAQGRTLAGDLAFNIRMLGGEFYIFLDKLESDDPSLNVIKPMIAAYKGRWLKLADEFVPETMKNLQAKDEAALAREKELKELFKESDLFEVTKEYGMETVNGQKAYHYGVELNQKGIEDYLKASVAITGGEVKESDLEQSIKLIQAVKEAELWIGTEDYLLYKGFLRLAPQGDKSNLDMLFELNFEAKSYNDTVAIEAPKDAQDFNPLSILPMGAAAEPQDQKNPQE